MDVNKEISKLFYEGWLSVEDTLPAYDKTVLLRCVGPEHPRVKIEIGHRESTTRGGENFSVEYPYKVSHWQHLPDLDIDGTSDKSSGPSITIHIFANQIFNEIPHSLNPALQKPTPHCLMIISSVIHEPGYTVLYIQDDGTSETVTRRGIFWSLEHALVFARALSKITFGYIRIKKYQSVKSK